MQDSAENILQNRKNYGRVKKTPHEKSWGDFLILENDFWKFWFGGALKGGMGEHGCDTPGDM